jgi:uncharacterized protein YjbI with pentapeptide repeats
MTELTAATTRNGFSPGCLAGLLIAALVLGVGALVVMLLAFSGGMEDAVPSGGFLSSTTTTISQDCLTAQEGREPSHQPAHLHGCDLTGIDLTAVDLSGADLAYASLAHVVLVDAILSGADLSGTNLFKANLSGANLTSASLSNTDLALADLTGANLTGAILTGVRWLNTTCPDGTNSDNHASTCVGYGI